MNSPYRVPLSASRADTLVLVFSTVFSTASGSEIVGDIDCGCGDVGGTSGDVGRGNVGRLGNAAMLV